MRAPRSAPALVAAALALAAAGCGETLVDHTAPSLFLPPDGVTTIIQGACNTVDACGASCSPCPDPAGLTTGAASAQRACYDTKPTSTCDYQCTGGLIKCPGGCCQASQVAAGRASSCAITSGAGGLFCWGDNAQHQIDASAVSSYDAPQKLHGAGVSAVAVGEGFTCAIVSGAVECRGTFRNAGAVPSPVVAGAVELAAGADHACARTAAGAVVCWGSNALGQRGGPGDGTVAQPVSSGATAISAGTDHTCAVVAGAVRCWGSRAAGQLGDGLATGFSAAPVVPATAGGAVGAVTAGGTLSCAAPAVSSGGGIDDALQCWGTGLGSLLAASPQTTPAIPMKSGSQSAVRFQVDALGAGKNHVCVKRNGPAESVKCLGADPAEISGANAWGQLGAPFIAGEAVTVPGTQDAAAFAVGAEHGCAVLSSGAVACWGRNSSGQLGDGSRVTPGVGGDGRVIGTPVPVSGR